MRAGGTGNRAKVALEYLFDRGELMVAYRQKFQRYYDLSERVLADKNLKLDKTLDDYQRWTIERGLRHIGIAAIDQIADYYRQPKRRAAGDHRRDAKTRRRPTGRGGAAGKNLPGFIRTICHCWMRSKLVSMRRK